MRSPAPIIAALLLCQLGIAGPWAQSPDPAEAAQELVERERVRAAVQEAFRLFGQPGGGDEKNDNMVRAAGMLEELGGAAVPFLATELRQARPGTFVFVAYSLGRVGTPEAEAALREAIEAAEKEPTDAALIRKAWACYGLALMNRADAVDLLDTGIHKAASEPIHAYMSALEAAAYLTAPESVPRLLAQLDRYSADPTLARHLVTVLRALRRVSDPSSIPALVGMLDRPEPVVRREAAHALRRLGSEQALAALVDTLKNDVDPHVRYAAAHSLELIGPDWKPKVVMGLLRDNSDPFVRGALYRLRARMGGEDVLDELKSNWGRPSSDDRRALIEAVNSLGDPRAVDILGAAISDPDARVVAEAARGLARLGGDTPGRLLGEAIESPSWNVAGFSARAVTESRVERAGPAVARRLLTVELADLVRDPRRRARVYALGDAAVALGLVRILDPLKEAAEKQEDGSLVLYLQSLVRKLEALRQNGEEIGPWIELIASEDEGLRLLAYDRLGRLGGEQAARALVGRFGRVERDEGVAILKALAHIDAEPSRDLFERVLVDPEFDPIGRETLRAAAAWGARTLGGPRMLDALKRAVERRSGRDARVLIYLAVLGREAALPTLRAVRKPRMRYLKATRGVEQEKLEWILHELERGRTVDMFDVPPEDLRFHDPT